MSPDPDDRAPLLRGQLRVLSRIRSASNATFLCESTDGAHRVRCVYKPVAGERPLWDFPDETLAGRELCSYLISKQLGWNIVPDTVIRDGPVGVGMVQRWVDQPGAGHPDRAPQLVDLVAPDRVPPGYLVVLHARDHTGEPVALVHADDARLRRIAVFDVLINNADRKAGHILCGADGQLYGVDHGLCLHADDKLRTVLWGWAGELVDDETLTAIAGLVDALAGPLAEALRPHLSTAEIAALCRRAGGLLNHPVLPGPAGRRPIPWPVF